MFYSRKYYKRRRIIFTWTNWNEFTSGFQYVLRLSQATTPLGIFLGFFSVSREFAWNTAYPLRPSPPNTKLTRCSGQIVMSWIFSGVWKQPLRARISSISVSQPLNWSCFLWLDIFFEHDTKGTILRDAVFDFGSAPHSPPTKSEKVHAIAQYCKSTFTFND